ncbi:uncharacterized protein LOC101862400 [Aplysia californica]|uniref:Uncharacterized protein LOC101862400 n=1 Tax=Aplysia californica TaxID=6500 RepID=A0ABM1VPL2_APLCA|nr:uncharacterized protein LOC101862400 [Aplysia californica]
MKLHKVEKTELPVLLEWLKGHLPDSFKLYSNLKFLLRGWLEGWTFYALVDPDWPHIMAAGEGLAESDKYEFCAFFTDPHATCVFSPNNQHVRTLLTWPGFLDWTQPIIFHGVHSDNADVVEEVSQQNGGGTRDHCYAFDVRPEDLVSLPGTPAGATAPEERWPVPEDLTLRQLDPDTDTARAVEVWHRKRRHATQFVNRILKHVPSLGLFTKGGRLVAMEYGTHWGTMGTLHVDDDYRGRGLAKILTCRLAHKFYEEGLPAIVNIISTNAVSKTLHTKLGFRPFAKLDWYMHGDIAEYKKEV